ncbi:MAG: carbon-nitrogen hydrolase family protein [Pseudomonadota bacterium]
MTSDTKERKCHVACVQMRSGVDIEANVDAASTMIRQAAGRGANVVATPEMTALLDIRPGRTRAKAVAEDKDRALQDFQRLAEELGIWLLVGSHAVTSEHDERLANRSFLLAPDGRVHARYDKIHMFDVEVGDGQSYRESKAYCPGTTATLAETPIATIGMTICYDLRFPNLYRVLAQAGAEILMCPSAFTRVTGRSHWHTLLKARAIETGSFIIAPAQGGDHDDGRETFGHSMIISPWGDVLAEANGEEPGIITAEIDLAAVAEARARIPSLSLENPIRVTGFTLAKDEKGC